VGQNSSKNSIGSGYSRREMNLLPHQLAKVKYKVNFFFKISVAKILFPVPHYIDKFIGMQ